MPPFSIEFEMPDLRRQFVGGRGVKSDIEAPNKGLFSLFPLPSLPQSICYVITEQKRPP